MSGLPPLRFDVSPPVGDDALNTLFAAAWPRHTSRPWAPVLSRSLAYVCAFDGDELVGFVNTAWDGGVHAFVLDTTVHPRLQRHGVGRKLVQIAAEYARQRDMEWLHVDFDPELEPFYAACGFEPTPAGLIWLGGD